MHTFIIHIQFQTSILMIEKVENWGSYPSPPLNLHLLKQTVWCMQEYQM